MTAPTDPRTIRIGTRGSRLARWQADWVADALRERSPGLAVELVEILGLDVLRVDNPGLHRVLPPRAGAVATAAAAARRARDRRVPGRGVMRGPCPWGSMCGARPS